MAPKRRGRQTHLTFEPVGSESPRTHNFSPARIRYSENPIRPSRTRSSPVASTSRKYKTRMKQGKLISTSATPNSAAKASASASSPAARRSQVLNEESPARVPTASFLRKIPGDKRYINLDSSDELAAEDDSVDDDDDSAEETELKIVADPSLSRKTRPDASTSDMSPSAKASDKLPLRSSQSVSTRLQNTTIDENEEDSDQDSDDEPVLLSSSARRGARPPVLIVDSDESETANEDQDEDGNEAPVESEDDDEPIAPRSSKKRRISQVIDLEDDEEDEEDDEEEEDEDPVVPSSALRRRRPVMVELDDSEDELVVMSPTKKQKRMHEPARSTPETTAATDSTPRPGRLRRDAPSSPSAPRPKHKGHRSEKQKQMELLRRRRGGEKIDALTSSESESEDEHRGLYDSDGDDGFQVLKEFEDDEEEAEEPEPAPQPKKKNKAKKKARKNSDDDEGEDEELDDFIDDDDDAPLGAPLNLMPLEFTSQAHKPLKEQFPYVIEWLVHNRINPAFDRSDAIYRNAWRKLDDEVHGLASSKFMSSAWKPEFNRALRARPTIDAFEMHGDAEKYTTCEACGRSGHPSTWMIIFQGHPYHKDTLDDIESDSDSDSSDDENADHDSVDADGNVLPPASRRWAVGAVCSSNAETAHSLVHWKHALKDWVEEKLDDDGWMAAKKLKEREKMKARKRRKLANQIVDDWQQNGVIASLYGNFKANLENARTKSTTGRVMGRGRFR